MIIFNTIAFLRSQLNSYLKLQLGDEHSDTVFISNLVNQDGTIVQNTTDRILITLINVEEERIGKAQIPKIKAINGQAVKVSPEINLNLNVLIIANRSNYEESLKFLSHVITFFQGSNVFNMQNSPSLDSAIEKLIVELSTLSLEQLNNMWGYLGAKYMPSVMYKVRMLTIQEGKAFDSVEGVAGINKDFSAS